MDSSDILPSFPSGSEKPRKKPSGRARANPEAFGVVPRADNPGNYQIRYQRPEVAKYVAQQLILNGMDYEAVVAKMLNTRAEADKAEPATEATIILVADNIRKSSVMQQAVRERLKEIGCDEDADRIFMAQIWAGVLDRKNDARHVAMMKLYSTISPGISKRADTRDKPETLAIEGAEGLIKNMGIPVPSNELEEIPEVNDELPEGS